VAPGDDAAVAALAAYVDRYAAVAHEAGTTFPFTGMDREAIAAQLTVVEHVEGSAGTDFGAPLAIPKLDAEPMDAATAHRHADLVAASWRVFDAVVAGAPAELRKGPRGGGRDRDEIVAHVAESERSYARSMGIRYTPTQSGQAGGQAAMHAELVALLRRRAGRSPAGGKGVAAPLRVTPTGLARAGPRVGDRGRVELTCATIGSRTTRPAAVTSDLRYRA
jgi:hypothetical protein